MKGLVGSVVLLYGIASAMAIPRPFSATTQPTVSQNLTVPPSLSNEQSMTGGAINGPTFTYEWHAYHELPMSLPTLQRDLKFVMTSLDSRPHADPIPSQGLAIAISRSSDLWAIKGPFTYEVAAWYARAMLMYFEQRGNPHCALLLAISRRGEEIGSAEIRPHYTAGQGGENVTDTEPVGTVDTVKKY